MRPGWTGLTGLLALGFVVSVGVAQAQTVGMNPELEKVIEGAKKEGKLVIRSTTSVNGGAAHLDGADDLAGQRVADLLENADGALGLGEPVSAASLVLDLLDGAGEVDVEGFEGEGRRLRR